MMNTTITVPGLDKAVDAPRLFCIGRNYAAHAAEMQSPMPERPMVFLKPSTALVRSGGQVELPVQSKEVHHEVELVAVMGREGRYLTAAEAASCVAGYAVGLDMTARDLQAEAKKKGHPWSVAKGFDTFAPLGEIVAAGEIPDPQDCVISLRVNGEIRQQGSTRDMHVPVYELVAYCSSLFTLLPGDLIYTGTPEGVGPVRAGDKLEASITGLPDLVVSVVDAAGPN